MGVPSVNPNSQVSPAIRSGSWPAPTPAVSGPRPSALGRDTFVRGGGPASGTPIGPGDNLATWSNANGPPMATMPPEGYPVNPGQPAAYTGFSSTGTAIVNVSTPNPGAAPAQTSPVPATTVGTAAGVAPGNVVNVPTGGASTYASGIPMVDFGASTTGGASTYGQGIPMVAIANPGSPSPAAVPATTVGTAAGVAPSNVVNVPTGGASTYASGIPMVDFGNGATGGASTYSQGIPMVAIANPGSPSPATVPATTVGAAAGVAPTNVTNVPTGGSSTYASGIPMVDFGSGATGGASTYQQGIPMVTFNPPPA